MNDIYDGKSIYVWEDEGVVFLTIYINGITISFPKEEWESIKEEFDILINGEPNHNPAG
jgi:hypothetical protein